MELTKLNDIAPEAFVAQLGGVFEHSPWVAERARAKRPFADLVALHTAMMDGVRTASRAEQLALIRAHPELAGREAVEGSLTVDSSGEQGRLGFTALSREEFQRVQTINRLHREKFGFPCIVALLLHANRQSVLDEMQRSLDNDEATEIERSLVQIAAITKGRLQKMLGAL